MSERIVASKKINDYKEPTRTIIEKDVEFVLTARKIVFNKRLFDYHGYKDSVGYLIDKDGNLTRNLDDAFVIKLGMIFVKDEYTDSINEWYLHDRVEIQFIKNGLFIMAERKDKAQQWLYDNPLPRKSISSLTRGNVYAKYNGHCAYCGCELDIQDMQVDHHTAYKALGGEDGLENYYPACDVCNRVKSNKTIEHFKKAIQHCGEIHRKRKHPIMADSDKIAIKYGLTTEDHEIVFFYETYNPKVDVKKIKPFSE